jgi:hypothetical protein
MTYSLAAAAAATGMDESTILKAIEGGTIPATKDELGEWHIEPTELHRAYPPDTEQDATSDTGRATASDATDLEDQIAALIRQAGDRLRQQFDELKHSDRDSQRPVSDKPERHSWWRRIAG